MLRRLTVTELVQLFLERRQLGRSSLPGPVRHQAMRDWTRLTLSRERDLPNPMRLLGRETRYFGVPQLRWLWREIFVEECYRFVAETPRPRIIDCGSNVGLSILYFKRLYPGAQVTGFEPDPEAFHRLTDNIASHGLTDVALHNCALSDQEGELDFYRSDTRSLRMSLFRSRSDGQRISVPSRLLSSFVTEPVDLLKVDVEGAEEAVLRDLVGTGRLRMVRHLHLEYHHHLDAAEDRLAGTLAQLEEAGFGYQVSTRAGEWGQPRVFQDVSIFAYRKD